MTEVADVALAGAARTHGLGSPRPEMRVKVSSGPHPGVVAL